MNNLDVRIARVTASSALRRLEGTVGCHPRGVYTSRDSRESTIECFRMFFTRHQQQLGLKRIKKENKQEALYREYKRNHGGRTYNERTSLFECIMVTRAVWTHKRFPKSEGITSP